MKRLTAKLKNQLVFYLAISVVVTVALAGVVSGIAPAPTQRISTVTAVVDEKPTPAPSPVANKAEAVVPEDVTTSESVPSIEVSEPVVTTPEVVPSPLPSPVPSPTPNPYYVSNKVEQQVKVTEVITDSDRPSLPPTSTVVTVIR